MIGAGLAGDLWHVSSSLIRREWHAMRYKRRALTNYISTDFSPERYPSGSFSNETLQPGPQK